MISRLKSTRQLAGVLATLALLVISTACQSAAAAPAAQAPAAQAPASQAVAAASNVSNLFLMADLVQGSKNVAKDQAALRSCVLSSRFARNSEMVFRVRVYDPKTGNLMNKDNIKSIQISLADGKTIDMHYANHPANPPGEAYWTGSWVIPKDHATGTLSYTIHAVSADGRTGDFKPFSVAASLPSITDEVLADIPTGNG